MDSLLQIYFQFADMYWRDHFNFHFTLTYSSIEKQYRTAFSRGPIVDKLYKDSKFLQCSRGFLEHFQWFITRVPDAWQAFALKNTTTARWWLWELVRVALHFTKAIAPRLVPLTLQGFPEERYEPINWPPISVEWFCHLAVLLLAA